MTPYRYASVTLALAALLSGACASESGSTKPTASGDPASSAHEVTVVNIAYAPETIRVDAGTEVVWVNEDESVHHTVTSGTPAQDGVPGVSKGKPARPDGEFDGDLPDVGSDFRFTFERAGTYAYFCNIHPSMTGEVIVE